MRNEPAMPYMCRLSRRDTRDSNCTALRHELQNLTKHMHMSRIVTGRSQKVWDFIAVSIVRYATDIPAADLNSISWQILGDDFAAWVLL